MLTKKQKCQLDAMEKSYYWGMVKTTIAPIDLIEAWAKRYRSAMERQLQKRCRH